MGTHVVLLGTGTPNADSARSGPAVALVVNDRAYLVDFGPGVVRRAAAAAERGIDALAPERIEVAFLTHLHSDHTAGFPDLILTPWVLGRSVPLKVYGPRGLHGMTRHLIAAYEADIRERIDGLERANETGWQVEAHEIAAGTVYIDDLVRVEALPANHGSWPAFSYRFTTADRTIVVSGDTAPHDRMLANYTGCDVLVHEVYSTAGFARRPAQWQRYHSAVHTSTLDLARIAAAVHPGLLVLYHQLFWGETPDGLLAEIATLYDGPVVSANDLDVF
ncbi:MAG: MBL fold metallo-hydrolase [Caldilineales bacterium]